jgi:hypothetical protein
VASPHPNASDDTDGGVSNVAVGSNSAVGADEGPADDVDGQPNGVGNGSRGVKEKVGSE